MKNIWTIAAITLTLGMLTFFANIQDVVFAKRAVFVTGSQDELENAKRISRDELRGRSAMRAVGNSDEFHLEKAEIDRSKFAHVRFRQVARGVPVWGGEAIVHLRPNGEVFAITDDLLEAPAVNTQPSYSPDDAVRFAKQMYKGSAFLTEEPVVDLWVIRGKERDHLAYRVQMRREDGTDETAMPIIFVDAQTGEKVFEYDNLQTGVGGSLYSGQVTINTDASGRSYYLEDPARKMGTFDMRNGTSSFYRFTDADDKWVSNVQRAGVDAHYGAAKVYDYYLNVHGRNGLDGNGGPGGYASISNRNIRLISSRVHYSRNYNNAFWNGTYMTYGDGDGNLFSPLVTLDIAGHEMTHGVIEHTAGLVYANESGALNESFADVFGAMVERYTRGESADTWKIGEQAFTPTNGTSDALRYLDNPHLAQNSGYTADDDPDHYSERFTGAADNGGVHTNSGIGNKAFYLLAAGGTHHRSGVTVNGIGADQAADIWYLALTTYMTSSTNFAAARTATLDAAAEIFGPESQQYLSVGTTWCAVGVGACPGPTPTPTPTPTELLENGGFEVTQAPWVLSGTGSFYVANGNYPHDGTGYIYLGVSNSVTGQAYQELSIPATASGVFKFYLNVTSSESTTTVQYDRLFVEVRNTSGTLLATLATYSNLNKGTAGAYVLRTLNASAFKGQTVRLQFRSTMDSSLSTTFRVDDVSLE
jgi:Zn-dependent metalloprotease